MENNLVPLENANQKIKELTRELGMLRSDANIAQLGDGNVFFLDEAGAKHRGFKVRVNLDYPNHFCFPGGDRPMITGEGYDHANRYANIAIRMPPRVVVQDGEEKGNPYFERDPETGAILSITMRGIGIGYSPTGELVPVDVTVFVNLQTTLVQEIQAKMKYNPCIGQLGTKDDPPKGKILIYKDNGEWGRKKKYDATPTEVDATGRWHFIPSAIGIGYWVNLSHPAILEAFDSYTQKQRFLERSTATIMRRLILARHPAIGTKTPFLYDVVKGNYDKITSAKAYIIVYGFKHSGSPKERDQEMEAMADKIGRGENLANMEIIKEKYDAAEDAEITGVSDADPAEVHQSLQQEFPVDNMDGVAFPPPEKDAGMAGEASNGGQAEGISAVDRVARLMDSNDPEVKAALRAAKSDFGANSYSEIRGLDEGRSADFLAYFHQHLGGGQ